jgi:hypothetical protein
MFPIVELILNESINALCLLLHRSSVRSRYSFLFFSLFSLQKYTPHVRDVARSSRCDIICPILRRRHPRNRNCRSLALVRQTCRELVSSSRRYFFSHARTGFRNRLMLMRLFRQENTEIADRHVRARRKTSVPRVLRSKRELTRSQPDRAILMARENR